MSAPALGDEQDPFELVNDLLGLGARATLRGDEIKYYSPDGTGELRKGYLNRFDCESLASAFATLAASLRVSTATEGK